MKGLLGWPVVAVFTILPVSAFAHAHLSGSSPPEDATVAAPAEVSLRFTQALEKAFSSVEVRNARDQRVDTGEIRPDREPAHLIVGLPKLPPGTYKVIWHATSVDTHRTEGSFTFIVAP